MAAVEWLYAIVVAAGGKIFTRPSEGLLIGCMACGAVEGEPCRLDKGDGICPELNAPVGSKVQHGNDVSTYAEPEDDDYVPFPEGAGIGVVWSR